VQVRCEPASSNTPKALGRNVAAFSDTKALAGTTYSYQAAAFNAVGRSGYEERGIIHSLGLASESGGIHNGMPAFTG
jgi:hypothetical protein